MCPPCKVIFNQGFTAAAEMADALREQILDCEATGRIDAVTRDALLLKLGQVEAAAISGVWDAATAFATALGEPEWAELFAST